MRLLAISILTVLVFTLMANSPVFAFQVSNSASAPEMSGYPKFDVNGTNVYFFVMNGTNSSKDYHLVRYNGSFLSYQRPIVQITGTSDTVLVSSTPTIKVFGDYVYVVYSTFSPTAGDWEQRYDVFNKTSMALLTPSKQGIGESVANCGQSTTGNNGLTNSKLVVFKDKIYALRNSAVGGEVIVGSWSLNNVTVSCSSFTSVAGASQASFLFGENSTDLRVLLWNFPSSSAGEFFDSNDGTTFTFEQNVFTESGDDSQFVDRYGGLTVSQAGNSTQQALDGFLIYNQNSTEQNEADFYYGDWFNGFGNGFAITIPTSDRLQGTSAAFVPYGLVAQQNGTWIIFEKRNNNLVTYSSQFPNLNSWTSASTLVTNVTGFSADSSGNVLLVKTNSTLWYGSYLNLSEFEPVPATPSTPVPTFKDTANGKLLIYGLILVSLWLGIGSILYSERTGSEKFRDILMVAIAAFLVASLMV